MDSLIFSLAFLSILTSFQAVQKQPKYIERNGMSVTWSFANERIYFEVSAPTTGWITIGFNETNELKGAYLLMARVYGATPEVVEHAVYAPGDYRPIEAVQSSVADVNGIESSTESQIRFSLPMINNSKFAKKIQEGQHLYMILAYSESDDFQHHSIMRTAALVQL